MRKYRHDERGLVTAECAVALPAITVVLWLALELGAAMHTQLLLNDATNQTARSIARNEPESKAGSIMANIAPRATWTKDKGEYTTVKSHVGHRLKSLPATLDLTSTSTIRTETTLTES